MNKGPVNLNVNFVTNHIRVNALKHDDLFLDVKIISENIFLSSWDLFAQPLYTPLSECTELK